MISEVIGDIYRRDSALIFFYSDVSFTLETFT